MLSPEVADYLQLVTFPLELIGLSLAVIEIRFTSVAARINDFIRGELDHANTGMTEGQVTMPSVKTIAQVILVLMPWLLGAAFLYFNGLPERAIQVLLAPLLAIIGAIILALLLWRLYIFVHDWVPGRTVGTVGVLVAGLGVIGEGYQFAVQLGTSW